MAGREIPQEVIDYIIDCYEGLPRHDGLGRNSMDLVQEDEKLYDECDPRRSFRPLMRFSLVARSWLPRSRHHLFREPYIESLMGKNHTRTSVADRYASLYRLLVSPHKDLGPIGPFFRHLWITNAAPRWISPDYFPALDKLTINGYDAEPLLLGTIAWYITAFPKLQEVRFRWARLAILADIDDSDETDDAEGDGDGEDDDDDEEEDLDSDRDESCADSEGSYAGSTPFHHSLHTIHVIGTSVRAAKWLAKLTPPPRISTVILSSMLPSEIPHMNEFLTGLTDSLEDLAILSLYGILPGYVETAFAKTVDLGVLHKLQYLVLPSISLLSPEKVDKLGRDAIHAVDFFLVLLKSLSPSIKLRTLTIKVKSGDLAYLPWDELADTLDTSPFAALEHLFFEDYSIGDQLKVPQAEALINRGLSRIAARGILSIHFRKFAILPYL
ncbi:hypothetical protein LshimejAT787_1101910 [Lyophyllum shimeji]|uniref:Uncharacterized protein n=1 Tax=Lyophyllum shimeji TaxID=47721 RepID=A0A9P3UTH7_LYOSH|nr:hypothetical protein LshimejAT787_1101910 [Lyophyllum shimeji]